MHIAIADDNIADRKQIERLLGREATKRKTEDDGFYVDSYGSSEAIMPFPQMYQLFFIDMVSSEINGLELACKLIRAGATGYVVLCSSRIDYEELLPSLPDDIMPMRSHFRILKKPIIVAKLSALLDELIPYSMIRTERIELRGLRQEDTLYIDPDELLYASSDTHTTTAVLTDGRKMMVPGEAYRLYMQVEENLHFMPAGEKAFINVTHIRKLSMFRVTMDDGASFFLSPYYSNCIQKEIEVIKQTQ